MNRKKRPFTDSRPFSFLQRLWGWFWELRPPMRVMVVGVVAVGIIFTILPQSLFHSFNCEVQNRPQSYRASNGYFIDRQVIVVGPRADVDAVIGTPPPATPTPPQANATTPAPVGTPATAVTLPALGTPTATGTPVAPVTTATTTAEPGTSNKVILNLIEGCDLSYLNTRKDLNSSSPVEARQLVMRLYEISDDNRTVEDVIADINAVARGEAGNNLAPTYDVSADPNYLTRLSDLTSDPCVDPADGSGGGGKPFGGPGLADPEAARDAFMNQWAFSNQGIDFTAWASAASSVSLTGRNVRVGVFDTSPYRITLPFFKRIGIALPTPLWFTNWDTGGATMVSNHGLFVAELIHGIAPKSRIQLIRVLNEDGCGDTWMFNKGLERYKSRMSAWSSRMDNVVINMSLGIRVKKEEKAGDPAPDAEDEAKEDLETLKTLITQADDMGAIIIAAAGNDSNYTDVLEMQIPASYDNVMGVGATDKDGDRSCYSNQGDISAPGGQGGKIEITKEDGTTEMYDCTSRASTWNEDLGPHSSPACTDITGCDYGLISLGRTRYGPQYMIWSGTSFATPLVSGLAALAYQENSHDQAACIIEEGTTPFSGSAAAADPDNMGSIRISESLSSAVVTRCRTRYPED